MEKLKIIRYN